MTPVLSRIKSRLVFLFSRSLYTEDSLWLSLENKWISVVRSWDKSVTQRLGRSSLCTRRSYVLSMFPYPSGNLHLGHLRVYTVADVLYRYQSMSGYAVLQPMGWDAFGLPAENAAIDRNVLPQSWTENNIKSMRNQMESTMLLGVDWSREISTCDPDYYRWTQWIFLKLYEAGLAYYRSAFVNWDPVDQTVLADELVDAEGKSWRSGAGVVRKPLRQWYFRITAFSESLLEGLKEIEGNQWRDVINMQRGWLGRLDGTQMEFDIVPSCLELSPPFIQCSVGERISVFTRQPGLAVADLISHIEVHRGSIYFDERFRMPEHLRGPNSTRKLVLYSYPVVTRSGKCSFRLEILSATIASCWPEQLSVSALHPFSGRYIPMVRLPYSNQPETAAFPNTLCFRLKLNDNFDAGKLLQLPSPTAQLCPVGRPSESVDSMSITVDELDSHLLVTPVNQLDGLPVPASNSHAMNLLRQTGRGGFWSNDSRSDWLVSRQRYWGTPIPIIHCSKCGPVPVPEDELPVLLPKLKHPLQRGDTPLKDNIEWLNTTCPRCTGPATRETDTLDTFVDSSWYYLRYLDPRNARSLCDASLAGEGWLPVNVYVGGVEHGIRHLYYARFVAHFLHGLGIIPYREPFLRFLPVGLVLGQTYKEPRSGRYVAPSEVIRNVNDKGQVTWVERDTGIQLQMTWDKMSKSKLNGVDPTDIVGRHGIEVVRLMMLANVGPHRERKWQEDGVLRGILHWRSKLLRLVDNAVRHCRSSSKITCICGVDDPLHDPSAEFRSTHKNTLRHVNFYYSESFVLSSVIARLQELTDVLRKTAQSAGGPGLSSFAYLRALADLIVMLTPLAPLLSCELWSRLQTIAHHDCFRHSLTRIPSQSELPQSSLDSWPYCLSKNVLDQPFPCVAEEFSVESNEGVRTNRTLQS